MMAVGGSKEDVYPLIAQLKTKDIRIACFNSPSSLTISGDESAINELQTLIEEKQMFNRKLQVDVAYHSHHMKLVAKEYQDSLQSLEPPKPTGVKFHSSLLGHLVDGSELQPSYWVDNLTQAVRFSEALTDMCAPAHGFKTGVNMIVEIGPHSALAGPVKQILKSCGPNAMKIPYAPALVRKRDAVETALELAGALFVKGATLDLGAVNFPRPRKPPTLLVDMPRYPWNHQTKYWHESRLIQKQRNRSTPRNDILGALANYSNDLEPTWRNTIRIDDLPWLRHHKIQGLTLFPMSGFVAIAVEAASQRALSRGAQFDKFELRNVSVNAPLMITEKDVEITIQLRPYQEGTLVSSDIWDEFRIHSWEANKGWTEHSKGLIAVKSNDSSDIDSARLTQDAESLLRSTILEINNADTASVDKTKMYDALSELGVSYGPSFHVENCQANNSCSTAQMTVADTSQEMPQGFQTNTVIHPAFLEQLVKMYWPILGAGRTSVDTVYLPSSIGRMTISRDISDLTARPGNTLQAFCKGQAPLSHPKPMQVSMFATSGEDSKEALITLDDLTISPIIERGMSQEDETYRELCYKLDWEPILEPLVPVSKDDTVADLSAPSNGLPSEPSNGIHTKGITTEINDLSNGTPKPNTNGTSDLPDKTAVAETNGDLPNGTSNTTSGDPVSNEYPTEEVVIIHGESDSQKLLATKLADTLELSTAKRPIVGTLADVDPSEKLCLFVSELDKPLLSNLSATDFTALQKALTTVQGVLWIVRGAYATSENPDANMITGLSRAIRSETLLKFATLDLDSRSPLSEELTIKAILNVFKATFGSQAEANCELEFMERRGSFLTLRIINDAEMNEYVHKQTTASVLEPTSFIQEARPLKMTIGTPGAFESLHFVDDEDIESLLPEDEIEVEVKAIGVNTKDLLVATDPISANGFGVECSGVVTKVGASATKFAVGDRVAGITVSRGVYSTYTRVKAAFAFKIGNETSFEAAASIPIAYCTSFYGLIDLGRLDSDESVLVHGAACAAGQAAIALAQMVGAEIFATVGSVEEKELVAKAYGLPDDHILSSRGASFGPVIRQATNKRGVDVVLNSFAADTDTVRELWDSLNSFGRFVVIGNRDSSARLETGRFENTSFISVDLLSVANERPKIMQRVVSSVSELLRDRKIKAVDSITVFPISDVETAFKVLQSGTTHGKLVVMPQPEDQVKVCFQLLSYCLNDC
jgi:NADPH:quinone reductase-like Zn-dependent oxidoreductase/malonyl CoA-acyl carrier protein transacylase